VVAILRTEYSRIPPLTAYHDKTVRPITEKARVIQWMQHYPG